MMVSERSHYMGGPFSLRAAWGMFCSDHAQWDFWGCGALMLENRETAKCVGQVGINYGPLFPEWELGWLVYQEEEGHGYAFEAAVALRDWASGVRRLPTLVSYIDPDNIRSRKLAERLGATLDLTAPRPDPRDLVYRHRI
jgi:RimJ/RimL family protein N-acetyltransferase